MTINNFWKGCATQPVAVKTATVLFLVLSGCGAGSLPAAHASVIGYDVNFGSLGTLAGNSNYNLDFTLIPTAAANNSTTVNFSSFNYGTGSGPATLTPLKDAGTFNEAFSPFTAGNNLSFHFDVTYTAETPNPDILAFSLFTGSNNFTTTSTTPTVGSSVGDGNSYFTIAFNGAHPSINTYAGTSPAFAAPTVTETAPVPEPSTYAMMAIGVLALGMLQYKRKRAQGSDVEMDSLAELAI